MSKLVSSYVIKKAKKLARLNKSAKFRTVAAKAQIEEALNKSLVLPCSLNQLLIAENPNFKSF